MKEIPVIILPDGMAIEVNRLMFPDPSNYDANFGGIHYRSDLAKWKRAESQRRVFKIVEVEFKCESGIGRAAYDKFVFNFLIGSIHTAEIVNEKGYIQL